MMRTPLDKWLADPHYNPQPQPQPPARQRKWFRWNGDPKTIDRLIARGWFRGNGR